MNKIIIYLFLMNSLFVLSQEEAPKKEYKHSPSYLTLDVSSFTLNPAPRYRFGYIKRLNERWAVSLDLGYGDENISFGTYNTENYRLFEIRPEVYFVLNPGRKVQQYLSSELFYIHHNATLLNGHYIPKNAYDELTFGSADYSRQKYGIHLKYGVFINFTERLGFNPYAGFGYRARDNRYSHVVDLEIYDPPTDGLPFTVDYKEKEGLTRSLIFTIGFKLYYRFK